MIFALSILGHIDHAMALSHVPVNASGLGSRCLWSANLRQQGSVAFGIVAIGVVVGDDIRLVGVEFSRPVRQVAAVLKAQLIPI